jgi:hypothetical protein
MDWAMTFPFLLSVRYQISTRSIELIPATGHYTRPNNKKVILKTQPFFSVFSH